MTAQLTDTDYAAYSDLYKDIHGFRPRGETPFSTREEYERVMSRLFDELGDVLKRERQEDRRAVLEFVAAIRRCHAVGLDTLSAVRALLSAMDEDWDQHSQSFEHALWRYGIPPRHYQTLHRWAEETGLRTWAY